MTSRCGPGGVVPELREVIVLGANDPGDALLDVGGRGLAAGGHELPHEVGQLLGAVRVPAGHLEEPVEAFVGDALARRGEALAEEGRERRRRDRPDLELLRTAPERLVPVVEDPLEQVPLAAQVDVAHLGLGLEDGAHQVREPLVEGDDLLELVEDDHHAPLALGGQLAEQLEQPLDRVVDVGPAAADLEAEAQRAVARVDLDRRPDAQAAEELGRTLERLTDRRGDVRVDRLRQRRRQALLRRRLHQVAVADQRLATHRLLCSAQHQRRLAVPAWGVDEHVLPVAHVGDELAELVLPVGERFVEGEVAEGEGIGGVLIHESIMASEIEIRLPRTAPIW